MKKIIFSLLLIAPFMGVRPMVLDSLSQAQREEEYERMVREEQAQMVHLIERVEAGEADALTLNRLPGNREGLLRIQVLRDSCQRDLRLTEQLLQAGADSNFDDGLDTPLWGACSKEALKLLLKYRADPKKCKSSLLYNIYQHYCSRQKTRQPASMSDEDWLKEGIETMNLAIEAGADIHKGADIYKKDPYHLLVMIAEGGDSVAKRAFLSWAIRNGSDPNLPFRSDREEESVYAYLSTTEPCKHWEPLIRKERGWALGGPLLLAIRKSQPDDCCLSSLLPLDMSCLPLFMSRLPEGIVPIIVKMVLGHLDPFSIERQGLKTPSECGAN